jgi:hypothetical protein
VAYRNGKLEGSCTKLGWRKTNCNLLDLNESICAVNRKGDELLFMKKDYSFLDRLYFYAWAK